MQSSVDLTVGGYDPAGIATLSYDPIADKLSLLGRSTELLNASYGAYDAHRRVWCFVDEKAQGALVVARPHGRVGWRRISAASTGGAEPCFVAFDAKGALAAAANYASGEICLLKVMGDDPVFAPPPSLYRGAGGGPDLERQDGPHAHCARFALERLYHVDLGGDEVLVHDMLHGLLHKARSAFRSDPGEGPRHILFHPRLPVAWLLTELGSSIYTLQVRPDGTLRKIGRLSTLCGGAEKNLGGHLALDASGRRLYVSNRGDDSITTFSVDAFGGLSRIGIASVGAASPRHFILLEEAKRLVVACEDAGQVVCMAILADGRIGPVTARANLPQAAFVARRWPS